MIVSNITTPANLFHLLRRQLNWKFRKPCFVLSPKSLLRHPLVISQFDEFTKSNFKELINDDFINNNQVTKLVFCTGKFYYDLHEYRIKNKIKNVALIRIEQLHPFPIEQVMNTIKSYKNSKFILWAQEENKNMGYWSFISSYDIPEIKLISRKRSSSPSTGFLKIHIKEQEKLIKQVFK